ncbi:TPA: hypothetical protein N0F65_012422 [Lagenidium giganteum]|uniref:AGC protein kinase n=1 Tax=Lagenidium giganteum TaxID=4803 RepID=A0AAV2YP84_9STRA|nr:TPA: hypothetical protein N0F65_012422 [Lagenidium giganteum]
MGANQSRRRAKPCNEVTTPRAHKRNESAGPNATRASVIGNSFGFNRTAPETEDPVYELLDKDEQSTDSESEASAQFSCDLRHENLVMLPSKLDPLGRTIRRITTDVVDQDEQLQLVKRRASAAKAIALRNEHPVNTTNEEKESRRTRRPTTPKDFEYLKVIGIGGVGRVVLVRNRQDLRLYAMKVVAKRTVHENNLAEQILSERDVLGGTDHHSLVHLRWAFQSKTSLFLVMDYCPGGEISLHLRMADRFTEEVTLFYAAELALALEHLHRQGIVYRDLKPENLLLTEAGHLKLVDFGISKFGITEATHGAKTICGSYEYLAPEVFQQKGYGTAVDWWSFGAVVYEMLTGLPPWYCYEPDLMRKRIVEQPLELPSYLSEEAKDLLSGLLTIDPLQRLGSRRGSSEIKHHVFFRNIDWQMIMFREIHPPIRPCENLQSIEDASNFDAEFTRLSVGSVDSSSCSSSYDDFKGFNFEAPNMTHIEYGYRRDVGAKRSSARSSASEVSI